MLLGSVTPLHIRVDVDEHDAWRVPAERRRWRLLVETVP